MNTRGTRLRFYHHTLLLGLLAVALTLWSTATISAAKGGNGGGNGGGNDGGGNDGGGGTGETIYFDAVVDEFDGFGNALPPDQQVFWGYRCGNVGYIDPTSSDGTILFTGASSSIDNNLDLGNIVYTIAPECMEPAEDLETCFPGILSEVHYTAYGVVAIRHDDDPATPGVEEILIEKTVRGAFDKSGKSLDYLLSIREEPVGGGTWNPEALGNTGDAASLVLKEWFMEANKGNPARGCQLCGDFNEQAVMTLIRRDGPLAEGECQ